MNPFTLQDVMTVANCVLAAVPLASIAVLLIMAHAATNDERKPE